MTKLRAANPTGHRAGARTLALGASGTDGAHVTGLPSSGLVHADGRPADVVALEEALVSFFVDAANLLGIPKSVAAIYGICFASAEPLSFSEIDERLEISSGSISQGLRVLKGVGALKVAHHYSAEEDVSDGTMVAKRGLTHRAWPRQRERYEPDLQLRNLAARWIRERLETQLNSGRAQLQAILMTMPTAGCRILRDRVAHLQNWHDKAGALLPVMSEFLRS